MHEESGPHCGAYQLPQYILSLTPNSLAPSLSPSNSNTEEFYVGTHKIISLPLTHTHLPGQSFSFTLLFHILPMGISHTHTYTYTPSDPARRVSGAPIIVKNAWKTTFLTKNHNFNHGYCMMNGISLRKSHLGRYFFTTIPQNTTPPGVPKMHQRNSQPSPNDYKNPISMDTKWAEGGKRSQKSPLSWLDVPNSNRNFHKKFSPSFFFCFGPANNPVFTCHTGHFSTPFNHICSHFSGQNRHNP